MLRELLTGVTLGAAITLGSLSMQSTAVLGRNAAETNITKNSEEINEIMQLMHATSQRKFINLITEIAIARVDNYENSALPSDYGMDFKDVSFKSDNLVLKGWKIKGTIEDKAIILAHQYKGHMSNMLDYAKFLHDAGYTLLLFNFRAHYESEGDYISFGKYEVNDVDAATDYLMSQGYSRIGALGISMGATAVLLSQKVGVVVADSAFASANINFFDNIASELGVEMNDEDHELIKENIYEKLHFDITKFNILDEISSVKDVPTLLIYSDADEFIPPSENSKRIATNRKCIIENKNCMSQLSISSSEHIAYFGSHDKNLILHYEKKVKQFFNDYL